VVLTQKLKAHWLQILAHLGALVPLVVLAWNYAQNQLTANPIREVTLRTGRAALVLLVLSLASTPIYVVSGFQPVLRLRRPLGLYAFLYAVLHGLTFAGLDYGFNLALIGEEVRQKRFIQVGFLAFLILLPLALTSTRGWMARLGRNWKRLHRLVYLAALAAVAHYVWAVKADVRKPLLYGAIVVALLIFRIPAVQNAVRNVRARIGR
jgi:sulfoxide reductase heme-binding subunit YedZ